MKHSKQARAWRVVPAASAWVLVAGCASTTPPLPAAIATDTNEVHAITVAAQGVQVYECRVAANGTPSWTLVAPDAELFDRNGRRVGHHGAGPHWEAEDGSRLDGQVKSRADAPAPDAIPWLLLAARASGPTGTFSKVTSIQRVNTAGGKAPTRACSEQDVGSVARVPYRADYRMFVGRGPSGPSDARY